LTDLILLPWNNSLAELEVVKEEEPAGIEFEDRVATEVIEEQE